MNNQLHIKNYSINRSAYITKQARHLMTHTETLRKSNQWWENPANIHTDQKICEWEKTEIKYIPELMHKITYDFEPSNTVVYSLRGPRQVGKTTLIKLQIREFLDRGVSPWNIMYYSADLLDTPQDIVDVIESYLNISTASRRDNRYYLFLDEISSVPEWQRGIKWMIDINMLKNSTVMVTDSHSIDIRRSAERLPGRRGEINDNHDKILLPMKFSEYASVISSGIKNTIKENDLFSIKRRKSIFMRLLDNNIDDALQKFSAHQNELERILQNYMITGGIPKIVDEKSKTGNISEYTNTTYLESFMGQWDKLRKNTTLLKQFCGTIIKSVGNHISWNGLYREADLGSPNTAADYAHTLKDMFVLRIVHMYGIDKKIPMIKKDRKFYFQDPYFLHMFNAAMSAQANFEVSLDYTTQEDNKGKILEGIIADHLIRWAFDLSVKKQTFDYYNHIFYWKDQKNREVDFVLRTDSDIEVPIEVKYRNKIKFKELSGLCSFLDKTDTRNGIVVSKSDLETRSEYVVIPASLFLLLL